MTKLIKDAYALLEKSSETNYHLGFSYYKILMSYFRMICKKNVAFNRLETTRRKVDNLDCDVEFAQHRQEK